MRVLHINCNYIGTTLHQLMIEKLDALGIENEVFVATYDKSIAVINVNNNVYVSECFKKRDRLFFDYKQSKIIEAIEQHYDIKSFDLIHAYTLFTDGNVARVLSKKYNIPYVVAVRNTDVNDFFRLMVHLRGRGIKTMLAAKKVFFLSESYKKQVLNNYVPKSAVEKIEKSVEVIPNGIDDFWLKNEPITTKSPNSSCYKLVYAGSVDRNKNISSTQEAMKILRKQGVQTSLTVVGKIVQQDVYERIIGDAYTTYIAAQPKEKLIEIYRDNDIFVMPSIHESFGLVYAEAMSQALPIIYTKGQGFDGQFEDGLVGYPVEATNPEDISDRIITVISRYDEIRKNTVDSARSFSWDNICQLYLKDYIEVTEN